MKKTILILALCLNYSFSDEKKHIRDSGESLKISSVLMAAGTSFAMASGVSYYTGEKEAGVTFNAIALITLYFSFVEIYRAGDSLEKSARYRRVKR